MKKITRKTKENFTIVLENGGKNGARKSNGQEEPLGKCNGLNVPFPRFLLVWERGGK